jgi:hypothetical protein
MCVRRGPKTHPLKSRVGQPASGKKLKNKKRTRTDLKVGHYKDGRGEPQRKAPASEGGRYNSEEGGITEPRDGEEKKPAPWNEAGPDEG